MESKGERANGKIRRGGKENKKKGNKWNRKRKKRGKLR